MLTSSWTTLTLRRGRATLRATLSTSPSVRKDRNESSSSALGPGAAKKKLSFRMSPVQNLRNALEALDEMVEEADRKQLNDTNGKVLERSEKLFEVDKAKHVPSLKVKTLDGKHVDIQRIVTHGKATLMLTCFKNYGLDMLPAWRNGFTAAFVDKSGQLNSKVKTITLNVIEEWYMKYVSGSITRGLQDKIPKELHDTTFTHFGRCDEFRTVMALDNSLVGWIVKDEFVGCTAGGPATTMELDRLAKVTKQLLEQSSQSCAR
ncbi:putative ATPase assembly factor ATP10 [Plasmopara halstedii]